MGAIMVEILEHQVRARRLIVVESWKAVASCFTSYLSRSCLVFILCLLRVPLVEEDGTWECFWWATEIEPSSIYTLWLSPAFFAFFLFPFLFLFLDFFSNSFVYPFFLLFFSQISSFFPFPFLSFLVFFSLCLYMWVCYVSRATRSFSSRWWRLTGGKLEFCSLWFFSFFLFFFPLIRELPLWGAGSVFAPFFPRFMAYSVVWLVTRRALRAAEFGGGDGNGSVRLVHSRSRFCGSLRCSAYRDCFLSPTLRARLFVAPTITDISY